jgi:two-component system response regulator RegA
MSESSAVRSVLVVDHDPQVYEELRHGLSVFPRLQLTPAKNSVETLDLVRKTRFNLALFELTLGSESGLELLGRVHELDRNLPKVLLSARIAASAMPACRPVAAVEFRPKPILPEQVLRLLDRYRRQGVLPVATGTALSRRSDLEILDEIRFAGGIISDAARRLGVDRRTLQRRLALIYKRHPS